ncbi:hypothetical protein QF002_005234 [Paraburkholderia youngii]
MKCEHLDRDEQCIWHVVTTGKALKSTEEQVLADALATGETLGVPEERVREIFRSAWEYAS